jgi:hypothetical protein
MRRTIVFMATLALLVTAAAAEATYPPSFTKSVACQSGQDRPKAVGTFKIEGSRLFKVAVKNPCRHWVVVRWGPPGTTYAANAILVAKGTSTDLWRDELKPVPRDVGHLHFFVEKDPGRYCGGSPSYVAAGDRVRPISAELCQRFNGGN